RTTMRAWSVGAAVPLKTRTRAHIRGSHLLPPRGLHWGRATPPATPPHLSQTRVRAVPQHAGPCCRDRIRVANRFGSPPQFNHFFQPPELARIIDRENAGDPTILDHQTHCRDCAIEVASDA